MAYTTQELITDAWYESGIVSRDLGTPTKSQLTNGLRLLNGLLSFQAVSGRLIPYYQTYPLTAVVAQELYFIPNLVEIEAFTFNIGTVRFPSSRQKRKQYFGTGRANHINSLPVTWHTERTKGGMNLYLYFKPDTTYPLNLIGKFGLSATTLGQDLSTIYDDFYLDYLKYSLVPRFCASNAQSVPAEIRDLLAEYTQTIRDLSPADYSMEKLSTLQRGVGFSYADINIGRGWRP